MKWFLKVLRQCDGFKGVKKSNKYGGNLKEEQNNSTEIEIELDEARLLIQNGRYKDAINILLKLESISANFNIPFLLGSAYRRGDNFALAEKYYKDAIDIEPNCSAAYLGLGITYQMQLKFAESISSIEKAIETDRFSVDSYNSLGFTYKLKGDFDKAIETYTNGIEVLFDTIYFYITKHNEFVDEMTVAEKFKTDIWLELAIKIISKNTNDGIDAIRLPTDELSARLYEHNPYGSALFFDDGNVRHILPNMLNNFAEKLSSNLLYATLLNNVGMVLLELSKKESAKIYFTESIIFTPKNVEYLAPIHNYYIACAGGHE